ncbi:DUF1360 domain-containing protein [Actinosynnema sp. NPDC050436]|uniref:DUF1360 domain-containing protein n=1 Tax=Actinosynnema sp. NPDC050436 TaxID=3155659 RepID=UPI0033F6BF23
MRSTGRHRDALRLLVCLPADALTHVTDDVLRLVLRLVRDLPGLLARSRVARHCRGRGGGQGAWRPPARATCPFCSGVRLATALTAGLVPAPRATRLVATSLVAVAGSNFLHLAYDKAKSAVARGSDD